MNVQIRNSVGVRISSRLRAHVEGQLGLALGRFAGRIGRVVVHIAEIDGEQRCRIEVAMKARLIRVEGMHDDRRSAVDHAVSRASRSISRALEREQMLDGYGTWPATPAAKPKA